jgi:hypothetical protein
MAGEINWKRVAQATAHPTQVAILEVLATVDRLSPVQFDGDGSSVSRVAYHFRALHRAQLLESAGTAPRRGATEHFYRLSRNARG